LRLQVCPTMPSSSLHSSSCPLWNRMSPCHTGLWPPACLPVVTLGAGRVGTICLPSGPLNDNFFFFLTVQCLSWAKQVLHLLSYTPVLFAFIFLLRWGLTTCFLAELAWNHDRSASTSWVAGITGVSHHAWLEWPL
jgi:hypothetical protein